MTSLAFTASVIQAVAWPTCVLIIALVFRRQLVEAISRSLHRVKATTSGVELEFFGEQIRAISADVKTIEERQRAENADAESVEDLSAEWEEVEPAPPPADDALVDRLLEVSPAAAALEAYAQLEDDLRAFMVQFGLVEPSQARQSMRHLTSAALRGAVIDGAIAQSLQELTSLRNLLVHRGLPTQQETFDYVRAAEFIELTKEMRDVLSRIPAGRAYEAAIVLALRRLDVPYARDSASRDQGWDLLVGADRRIALQIKYTIRPLTVDVVGDALRLARERPAVIVSNVHMRNAVQRRFEDARQSGNSIEFVCWRSPSDDSDLESVLSAHF